LSAELLIGARHPRTCTGTSARITRLGAGDRGQPRPGIMGRSFWSTPRFPAALHARVHTIGTRDSRMCVLGCGAFGM